MRTPHSNGGNDGIEHGARTDIGPLCQWYQVNSINFMNFERLTLHNGEMRGRVSAHVCVCVVSEAVRLNKGVSFC